MIEVVLDASAVLALLNDEPGADEVLAVLGGAGVSSANVAEVAGKLADHGLSDASIHQALDIGFETLLLGEAEIAVMGQVRRATRAYGLSLGDRCCLATALTNECAALTADRDWKKVNLKGLKIRVLEARDADPQ